MRRTYGGICRNSRKLESGFLLVSLYVWYVFVWGGLWGKGSTLKIVQYLENIKVSFSKRRKSAILLAIQCYEQTCKEKESEFDTQKKYECKSLSK